MRNIILFCFVLLQSCFAFAVPGKSYIVQHNTNGYFTLNGYDFPYDKKDLIFPIELGDQLEVLVEEVIYIEGNENAYTMNMLLKSPKTDQSQYFSSREINNDEYETIRAVKEITRNIERLDFGKKEEFKSYLIWVQYEIELANRSIYLLTQDTHCKIDSYEEAKNISKSLIIEQGDLIVLGQGKYSANNPKREYRFTPKIYDSQNALRLGNLKLEGSKRKSSYKEGLYKKNEFEIYKKVNLNTHHTLGGDPRYRDVVFFKDFGKGLYFHFNEKTKVNLSNNAVLKYNGYYDSDGTRFYKFNQGNNTVEFYVNRYNPFTYLYYYSEEF